MNNLIVSMTRLSTAMTLFTVQQMQRTMKVMEDGQALTKTVEGFEVTLNSLTEVLTADAYERFDVLNAILNAGVDAVISAHRLPAHLETMGAKGSVTWRAEPLRDYRDGLGVDDRPSYLSWLWQLNRGVFKSPWTKQETWTTSVAHTTDDAKRYVENFEAFAEAVAR